MMLGEAQIQAAEHGLDPTNLGGGGGKQGLKHNAQYPTRYMKAQAINLFKHTLNI